MLFRSAEGSFRRGLEALDRGRQREALAFFEAALEIERRRGGATHQPRYMSYYGLCLGIEGRRLREGIELCRDATALEFYNPDLYLNLGKVLLAAGRRREAFESLARGYCLQPGHTGLRRELARMGRRRRPLLPFLGRRHPLNVLLGKLAGARPSRVPVTDEPTSEHREAESLT